VNEDGAQLSGGQLAVRKAPIAVSSARHSLPAATFPRVRRKANPSFKLQASCGDCLVANGANGPEKPSGVCRAAGWQQTLELPTICGPRVSPVPNYPTTHSPPSPAILYHGTLRTPQRWVSLGDSRSVERQYRNPHRCQGHFGNHPCENGVRVRYCYPKSRQGERSRPVPLLVLTSR
jgi:hypothetical protein